MNSLLNDVGFIGAFIGGGFVLVGQYIAHRFAACREEVKENNRIKSILEALNKEANYLHNITIDIFNGIKNNEEGKRFSYFTLSTQNYFSVYDNNSKIIGSITDKFYQSSVIKFHLLVKRLLDALLSNSKMLEKHIENSSMFAITQDQHFQNLASYFEKTMQDEAKHLKKLVTMIESEKNSYNEQHQKFLTSY